MCKKNILVFRTSVADLVSIEKLSPALNQLINGSGRWNFDLEDCDRILRVETDLLQPREVVATLVGMGFTIQELED